MNEGLSSQTARAFKWSSITELIAKLITPFINMVLARILEPEAFGMLATVTIVISFAEIFVESGFQKFIIQHHFEDSNSEKRYFSVAFWSNLAISALIWVVLIVFCDEIAAAAGNEGLGFPIAISAIVVPLYGIVGIQTSILKKKLEFKKLFYIRILSSVTPVIVTLPLALCGLEYWSLVIGNIASVVVQIIIASFVAQYKPIRYFNFGELKYMLGFGIWTLTDGLLVWATNWIDSLLISNSLSDYYLGLYKNSSATVLSLFTIVTAAITPVMFSSLSKLQNDQKRFKELFLTSQRYLCVFLLPIGVGLFLYRDFATKIMFGDDWSEAAAIVGIMAISTVLRTIFVSFYSDLYRAKGHFYVPVILQTIDVLILIPLCIFSLREGFWSFVFVRGVAKLLLIIPEFICAWIFCGLSPKETFLASWHSILALMGMCAISSLLHQFGTSDVWNVISILICGVVYFGILFIFKTERDRFLTPVLNLLKRKIRKGAKQNETK